MPIALKIDLSALQKLTRDLVDRGPMQGGPLRDMAKQWARRYEAFTRRRFERYSRGGGDWKPLALSTALGRRGPDKKNKTGQQDRVSLLRDTRNGGKLTHLQHRVFTILRDTGTLFNALSIGQPGNLMEFIQNGVRYGFGGDSKYKGGTATIAQIARFHDEGGKRGRPPKRQILDQPDQSTLSGMASDMRRATQKLIAIHGKQV